jgi:hypothetical protein
MELKSPQKENFFGVEKWACSVRQESLGRSESQIPRKDCVFWRRRLGE